MLVDITNIEDGNLADDDLFNTRFAKITQVINGNIEGENVKDASIPYAKLAVDDAAIPWSKIDAPNINGNGNGGGFRMGDFLIQWGQIAAASTGTNVTFAQQYAVDPTVTTSVKDPNSHNSWVVSVSPTVMTIKQSYASSPLTVHWIAVGKGA